MTNAPIDSSAIKRNYWPAILVFTLPWLADIIILSGQNAGVNGAQPRQIFDAPIGLMLNGIYAAAPFALMASAMVPRIRVSRALWGGAVLTAALWAIYAFSGRGASGAQLIVQDTFIKPNEYVTPQSGEIFLAVFIFLMLWPCIIAVLMGVAAKFRERPLTNGDMDHE